MANASLGAPMSANVAAQGPTAHCLADWIGLGVAVFGTSRLERPGTVFEDLAARSALKAAPASIAAWRGMLGDMSLQQLSLSEPLRMLADDYQLGLPDIFLLGICGEIENSYLLNLAIAELQAPNAESRPGMHLLCQLLECLFGGLWTPARIAGHPLLRDGLLRPLGEGPWPVRSLAIAPELWRLLNADSPSIAGCDVLDAYDPRVLPARLHEQLPRLAQLLRLGHASGLVLRGPGRSAEAAAAELAELLDRQPVRIDADRVEDESLLPLYARYGAWLPVINLAMGPGEHFRPPAPWRSPAVFLTGREGQVEMTGLVDITLPAMPVSERERLWREYVDTPEVATQLAESAVLDGGAIRGLADQVRLDASRSGSAIELSGVMAARARQQGNMLRQLAQPVERRVESDALVLPQRIERQLEQLLRRCTRREQIWEGLGPTAQASRSLGVRALFCGVSGTGKTLAASYMATRLGAPLYRLDLASVMNKYVGETEKNLGLLLDEAAASDVVLLLDEADALFGKRTEAHGAGDRFANMLTNFLLTRIELHPGIAILTSNSQARIDPAFMRRLDAVIEFPVPGAAERLLLWQRHLGSRSPGDEFCRMLASYSELSGGFIRNAVLNAAANTPHGTNPIDALILLQGLIDEYHKLGKTVPPKLEQLFTAQLAENREGA